MIRAASRMRMLRGVPGFGLIIIIDSTPQYLD
jgi:hypothetical protein